ncbi:hypothetical protein FE257_003854 [Aspergillus nanangensis]|uniref:C2H2-type domain-containing protein n=1 Tax=Aspergillus nanangensis TaxID=2582783 RepID=A0AAD4GN98_ASPNN|nr:hypothetical protein FE257_003854 [Aspergillus nanangensis]
MYPPSPGHLTCVEIPEHVDYSRMRRWLDESAFAMADTSRDECYQVSKAAIDSSIEEFCSYVYKNKAEIRVIRIRGTAAIEGDFPQYCFPVRWKSQASIGEWIVKEHCGICLQSSTDVQVTGHDGLDIVCVRPTRWLIDQIPPDILKEISERLDGASLSSHAPAFPLLESLLPKLRAGESYVTVQKVRERSPALTPERLVVYPIFKENDVASYKSPHNHVTELRNGKRYDLTGGEFIGSLFLLVFVPTTMLVQGQSSEERTLQVPLQATWGQSEVDFYVLISLLSAWDIIQRNGFEFICPECQLLSRHINYLSASQHFERSQRQHQVLSEGRSRLEEQRLQNPRWYEERVKALFLLEEGEPIPKPNDLYRLSYALLHDLSPSEYARSAYQMLRTMKTKEAAVACLEQLLATVNTLSSGIDRNRPSSEPEIQPEIHLHALMVIVHILGKNDRQFCCPWCHGLYRNDTVLIQHSKTKHSSSLTKTKLKETYNQNQVAYRELVRPLFSSLDSESFPRHDEVYKLGVAISRYPGMSPRRIKDTVERAPSDPGAKLSYLMEHISSMRAEQPGEWREYAPNDSVFQRMH